MVDESTQEKVNQAFRDLSETSGGDDADSDSSGATDGTMPSDAGGGADGGLQDAAEDVFDGIGDAAAEISDDVSDQLDGRDQTTAGDRPSSGSAPGADRGKAGTSTGQDGADAEMPSGTRRAVNREKARVSGGKTANISDAPQGARGNIRAVERSINRGVAESARRGRRRRRREDLGNFELQIPGTETTLEAETERAAKTISKATKTFGGGAGDVAGGIATAATGGANVDIDPGNVDADPSTGPAFAVNLGEPNQTVKETTQSAVGGTANLANVPALARSADEAAESGAFALSGLADARGDIQFRPENVDTDPSTAPVLSAEGAGETISAPPQRLMRRARRRARQTIERNFEFRPENLDADPSTEPVLEVRPGRAEEVGGGAVTGLAAAAGGRVIGPPLGRARRVASDRVRTFGADDVRLRDVTTDDVARSMETGGAQGTRFPGADDAQRLREDPAAAITEQARDRTPAAVSDRFTGDGPVFKKALDVEPDAGDAGAGGFKTQEGDFESPGSFVSSDLSPQFLRLEGDEAGTARLLPGVPGSSDRPTGVLIQTDIKNPDADTRQQFNQELRDSAGSTTVRAVDPDFEGAGGAQEIEGVLPPEAEFVRATGGGRVQQLLRRAGIGSDVAVRIDTPGGARRVPLRPVEPDDRTGDVDALDDVDAADGDAGAISAGADSGGQSLERFIRSPDADPDDPPAPIAPSSSADSRQTRTSATSQDVADLSRLGRPTARSDEASASSAGRGGGSATSASSSSGTGRRPFGGPSRSPSDGPPGGSQTPDTPARSVVPPGIPTIRIPPVDTPTTPPPPPTTTPTNTPTTPGDTPTSRPKIDIGNNEKDDERRIVFEDLDEVESETRTRIDPLSEISDIEADVGTTLDVADDQSR